jgi:hypothetical protein
MTEIYSYTSNTAKLFKHLPKLQDLQNGNVSPIMVHVITTHRCQLNCLHCCFKNRENRQADMLLEVWKTSMDQLSNIGVKALEFTGGGDPMLWPYLNEAADYTYALGMKMGMITNGLGIANLTDWNKFDWVRVSLNTLDYKDDLDVSLVKDSTAELSFCYIWNELSDKKIGKIIEFANRHKIACRLAPDCIKPLKEIEAQISYIRLKLSTYPDNEYVLLSDFNIDLFRENNDCRIHMIKPCLYLDGWLYACPSAELALENNKQISHKTRVCKYDDIERFYTSSEATEKREYDCSYCKYVKQQAILEALLMETKHNDFA